MKKLRILFASLFAVALPISIAGCERSSKNSSTPVNSTPNTPVAELVRITIKEGTPTKTTFRLDEQISFPTLVIIAHYDDSSSREITSGFTLSSPVLTVIDTAQTITVTYQEKTATFSITINSVPDVIGYSLVQWNAPKFIQDYKTNRTSNYKTLNLPYNIGDDNPFTLQPVVGFFELINGVPQIDDIIVNESYVPDYKIEMKNGESFQALTELTMPTYLSRTNNNLDFTADAIGKTFRITQSVKKTDDPDNDWDALVLEAVIVDGFNITKEVELGVIDNHSGDKGNVYGDWSTIKAANDLTDVNVNAVVIHRDLDVDVSELPSNIFYTSTHDSNVYMHRWANLYTRKVAEIDSFHFYGNYFTIKFDKVPLAEKLLLNGNLGDFAEAPNNRVFEFIGDGTDLAGSSYFKNISFFGNGNRADGDSLYKSGAMILFWSQSKLLDVDNAIMRAFLSMANVLGPGNYEKYDSTENTFHLGVYQSLFHLKNSKAFDSYSQMFYIWDGNMIADNCELRDAGGPIFITVDVGYPDTQTADQIKYFHPTLVTTNTTTSSVLSGLEPWFVTTNAVDITSGLKYLASIFEGNGKSIIKTISAIEYFNLVALAAPVNPLSDSYKLTYDISLNGGHFVGADDARISALAENGATAPLIAGKAPLFFSHTNLTDIGAVIPSGGSGPMIFQPLTATPANIYQGNFVNVMFSNIPTTGSYLGVVAEMFTL